MAFTVRSDSFKDGDYLAKDHILSADYGFGCEGGNKSPHLAWSGAPTGTKSFAVTCFDPDAPTGSGFWHPIKYVTVRRTVSTDSPADRSFRQTTEIAMTNQATQNNPTPQKSHSKLFGTRRCLCGMRGSTSGPTTLCSKLLSSWPPRTTGRCPAMWSGSLRLTWLSTAPGLPDRVKRRADRPPTSGLRPVSREDGFGRPFYARYDSRPVVNG